MIPLAITAHLHSGFVSSDPWSPSLDGILAYWVMRERLGPESFSIMQGCDHLMTPVEGLPLQVDSHDGWWWYACSSPIYTVGMVVTRHLHRRFDQAYAEKYLPEGTGKVLTAAGPYKVARMALRQVVTPHVTWHAIGDKAEIARLLASCHHVGGRLGAGFGRVRKWDIAEGGDADLAQLGRPLPVEYARAKGVEGLTLSWGLRPPGRIQANQAECVMPSLDGNLKWGAV